MKTIEEQIKELVISEKSRISSKEDYFLISLYHYDGEYDRDS